MSDEKAVFRFGKYDLIAHLATGGMAEIYLARQSGIGGFEKLVVIKRILPHLAREELFVQMFFDEARIAAQLNHQNVVQIYDLGHVNNQFFIAMEYLEGESLAELMRQKRKLRKPLSPVLAGGITMQMLEGLHYAHTVVSPDGKSLNVVHRDVNPQNIFVLYAGGVKLVDFGIAKAKNRFSKTETGMLKGKYGYMSPEQIRNMSLDARSDVYSAGVAFWEMLTGRKLFRQPSELEILKAITEEDPPPPSSINPAVPPELDAITMKALQRARELRYQSAGEMRMELSYALKRSREPSDTVAIGEQMHALFVQRMVGKRKLIQRAQRRGADFGDSLFGSLEKPRSDTEPSISRNTPSYIVPLPEDPVSSGVQSLEVGTGTTQTRASDRVLIFSILAAGLMGALVVVLVMWFVSQDQKKEAPAPKAAAAPAQQKLPPPPPVAAEPVPVTEPAPGKKSLAPKARKGKRRPVRKQRKRTLAKKKEANQSQTPPTASSPVESKAPGRLRLATMPWTTIYLGKRKLGVTPIVDLKLPPGRHTLRAVNPGKNIDRQIEIVIQAEQTTSKTVRF